MLRGFPVNEQSTRRRRWFVAIRCATVSALTVLAVSTADAAQLTLTWTDKSGGEAAFRVERRTGTGGTWALVGQAPVGASSYVDTTVASGTLYCYRVQAFNEAGSSGYSNEACGTAAGGALQVTVVRSGNGSGTVTSSPGGIACGGDCTESFEEGTVVTLTAVPGTGSTFSGWTGGGCAGTTPCTVTGNVPVTVTASFTANPVSNPTPPAVGDKTPPTAPPGLVASSTRSRRVELQWGKATDNVGVKTYLVERCQGTGCVNFSEVGTTSKTHYVDSRLSQYSIYRYRVRARDAAGNRGPYSNIVAVSPGKGAVPSDEPGQPGQPAEPGEAPSCPCSLWPVTAKPAVTADPDRSAVELGVRFRTDVNGFITGIRFYKSSANTGTHVGHLWTSTGQLLASVTFKNETSSGWQQADFPAPVPVTAGTVYVASYHTSVGRYSVSEGYFAGKTVDSGPVHTVGSDAGVYRYGASGFPTSAYRSSNYWVDVIFIPR